MALQAVQQQLALQVGGSGTVAAPPIPAFVPMSQPPPPAPAIGHSAGRGRHNAHRGAGRGRGNPMGIPPPSAIGGAIPPPAGGGTTATGGYQSNITKYYNNNNYCYSCGFDVAAWHTSSTCPANYHKNGHQDGCTRANYAQYLAAGHRPSKAAQHKVNMPTNPVGAQLA